MSSSLVWKIVIQPESHYLSDRLKHIFRGKFGDPVNYRLDRSDIPFLEGVAWFEKDAQVLIDLIERHGQIDIVEEY